MKYNMTELLDQLVLHEGLELLPYKDSLGIDTIGIGRNLEHRGLDEEELTHLGKDISDICEWGITKEQAYYLAERDIKIVEKEVCEAHPCVLELDEIRQRVIIDMAFNMGVPRLNKFKKMWKAIEEENFEESKIQMLDSRWASQVGNRAVRLSNAMETGEWV
jgi:lysozyme